MQKVTLIQRDLPYDVNEQYKYLRTNLQFCGSDKKVILFTSTMPGEGKSTTTLEIAKSMASIGKRVLLIDADLRRSFLKYETTDPKAVQLGLSHFLSGQSSPDGVLCDTNIPCLKLIFAGPVPPNPSELLSAHRTTPLLEWARGKFDYVFIDSTPLTTVIDAAIIAPSCDGAVVVVESGKTPYRLAQNVVRQLLNTGCPILGTVLNKVDFSAEGHHGYYKRYSYKYGRYGKYGYGETRFDHISDDVDMNMDDSDED